MTLTSKEKELKFGLGVPEFIVSDNESTSGLNGPSDLEVEKGLQLRLGHQQVCKIIINGEAMDNWNSFSI